MLNTLLVILFALGLVTSGGVTVAASQTASPDDVLYPVRILSEDVRLAVADPATEAALAYKFAEKNMLEISTKLASGEQVDEALMIRTELMFEKALQAAVNQPDDKAKATMSAFQTRLQKQLEGMEEPVTTDVETLKVHGRLQSLVETTLEVTAIGVIDPVLIRQHDRDRVNDNANSDQPRNTYMHSQPVDGLTVDPIQGNPWISGTITSTAPYSYSFFYATPNLDGTPRTPDQAGSGPGYGPGYKQP